jgi:hypothetical protein
MMAARDAAAMGLPDRQGKIDHDGTAGTSAGAEEFAMGVLLELLGGLLLVALIIRGVFGFVDDIKRRHHRG